MTRRIAADGSTSGPGTWTAFRVPAGAISKAQGVAIASDADGYEPSRVFVTARFVSATGGVDIYTGAYDASNGAVLWERTYNNASVNGYDYPVKITFANDWVYVAGVSAGGHPITGASTGPDYLVLRYRASDGASIAPWGEFRYNNTGSDGSDVLTDMYVEGQTGDPQGGGQVPGGDYLYVTGWSFNATSKNDYLTARVSLADPTQFVTIRSQPSAFPTSNDYATSLDYKAGTTYGRIFVTRYSNGNNGANDDYWTISYPLDLSHEKGSIWYNGVGNGTDQAV
ncbi:MAG: hypothetical protein AB7G11_17500 [Phycisphaerales bacterium]